MRKKIEPILTWKHGVKVPKVIRVHLRNLRNRTSVTIFGTPGYTNGDPSRLARVFIWPEQVEAIRVCLLKPGSKYRDTVMGLSGSQEFMIPGNDPDNGHSWCWNDGEDGCGVVFWRT